MPVMIQPAKAGSATVELLRRERSGRAQRLLSTLMLLDQGDGVKIGHKALCRLVRCDYKTLIPAIEELQAEGLLTLTRTEPPKQEAYVVWAMPPVYRLNLPLADGARRDDNGSD